MYQKIKSIGKFFMFLCGGLNAMQVMPVFAKSNVPEIIWKDLLPSFSAPSGTGTAMLEESWLLTKMLPHVLEWVLGFLATGAIMVIMIGGYMYLTSLGGDRVDKGKETILYGVVGLLIVILSYAIVRIVQSFDFFI